MTDREAIIRQARLRQSIEELRRKQRKAFRPHIWTEEDMDLADVEAERLYRSLHMLEMG
jgi:hypothetical protein